MFARFAALTLMTVGFLVQAGAASTVELKYSTGVTAKQRELLGKDLDRLATMRFGDSSGELRRVLKLSDTSASSLEGWLRTRARYVIDEKHPFDDDTVFALAPMEYPAAGDVSGSQNTTVDGVPEIASSKAEEGGGTPSTSDQGKAEDPGPTIVMANMGAALYRVGRENQVLVGFNVMGQGLVPITSPRVGLFQVGRGLFQPLSPKWEPKVVEDFVHSMFRMDTLFHEARHSDGSAKVAAKQLAFGHEICPPGHEYAGHYACDRPSNGPYRVGALILRSVIEGCGPECSARDTEILTLLYADSMSRILTPLTRASQVGQDDLCAKLLRTRTNIPFCEAPDESAVQEWDEAPEAAIGG